MTRLLVTGGAGFIGGRLASHFREQGADVRTDIETVEAGQRVVLTAPTLSAHLGSWRPDAVLHAAGSGTVSQVASDPERHVPGNLAATLGVLQYVASVAPKAHVVLVSSAAVYGNAPAQPQTESDTRPPVSLYGLSKAQSEQLLAHFAAQHGVQTTAVRLFSVYGPGLRKQLLWDAMNKFKAGRSDFFGTGDERRDWVHIDDVCAFMTALLQMPGKTTFDVFNCGGQAATTRDVLSCLAQQAGAPPPTFNGESRAGDPVSLVADCGKATSELQWRARVDWREGMAQYRRWHAGLAEDAVPASVTRREGVR